MPYTEDIRLGRGEESDQDTTCELSTLARRAMG